MKLGIMVYMDMERLDGEFAALRQAGFETCQLCCWQEDRFTPQNARIICDLMAKYGVEVSAFWCGWSGPCEWNLVQGPVTIGLVPTAYRHARLETLRKCSNFLVSTGITDIITHVGFIPNNPFDSEYAGLVGALRNLALHFRNNKQYFLFETGQEAPVTLLRTIEDIGFDNIGINLDPANLLMYGYGNPIDALDVFGKYVRNIHGKDGLCPANGKILGEETPIGQGKVNYPAFLAKLKEIGYNRYITIEREIDGEQQKKDIAQAKIYLENLWNE